MHIPRDSHLFRSPNVSSDVSHLCSPSWFVRRLDDVTPTDPTIVIFSITSSPTAPAPSPHAFVPTSSLCHPPPSSSTSSSSRMSALSFQDFTTAFPSIDDLEVTDESEIPSSHPACTSSLGSRSSRKPSTLRANPFLMFRPQPFSSLPHAFVPTWIRARVRRARRSLLQLIPSKAAQVRLRFT